MEFAGATYVVDYGKIYLDTSLVGFLFEDGYLQDTLGPLGAIASLRPIEALSNCVFRGIDTQGKELVLPGSTTGPTGTLTYNGVPLHVINGRLATSDHRLVGSFSDDGTVSISDGSAEEGKYYLDDTTRLTTLFEGTKSDGTPFAYDYDRPLYKRDRKYGQNETIRYFMGFESLSVVQKRYVLETMSLWASSGLLQVVRKSEGDASLGNVKHGAAGVTAVRTGNATFDKEEFDKDVEYYNAHGPLFGVGKTTKGGKVSNLVEIRLSLVVPHEFGHQLEFTLTQAAQDQIAEMYDYRLAACEKVHSVPGLGKASSELLPTPEVEKRHFVSGYAKSSTHEYWAECVAAFSIKATRDILKQYDPQMHKLLTDLVLRPKTLLRVVLHDTIAALQASLRLGGEFDEDILSR